MQSGSQFANSSISGLHSFVLTLNSRLPIAGAAALVCDSLNAQSIGCDTVVQGEWEASQNELPKIFIGRKPDFWLIEQQICSTPDLSFKTSTQTRYLSFIVNGGFNEFQLRVGVELQPHCFRRARTFSKTRSPGTGFTFPSRISRWRLCASM